MLLSTVIFGASGVIMGALNARQHFLLPALAPLVYNVGIILGILVWPPAIPGEPQSKVMGLAVGTVIGALGHLTVQLPGLRQKKAHYSTVLTLRDPGVRQVLRLMAPRILGLSFSQINSFVTLYLSGFMTLESLPALTSALRIMIMPQGILGQAMGIAAFPTLATLAAQSALDEMRHILLTSLRLIVFLGLPASVLLIMLREPIIVILLQRGAFGPADTQLVAWALLFYGLGLVALTALEVIARAFYALNDTLTPVLAGGIQVLGMALLSLWLSQEIFPIFGWLPLGGLALGFSLSNFLEVGLLLGLLRRKMGGINGRILLDGLWRMSIASLLMAGAIWITLAGLETAAIWWQALLGSAVGGIVYTVACLGLSVEEAQHFFRFSRRSLR
jgi:putative peptidoglycan lipid II flippase